MPVAFWKGGGLDGRWLTFADNEDLLDPEETLNSDSDSSVKLIQLGSLEAISAKVWPGLKLSTPGLCSTVTELFAVTS